MKDQKIRQIIRKQLIKIQENKHLSEKTDWYNIECFNFFIMYKILTIDSFSLFINHNFSFSFYSDSEFFINWFNAVFDAR